MFFFLELFHCRKWHNSWFGLSSKARIVKPSPPPSHFYSNTHTCTDTLTETNVKGKHLIYSLCCLFSWNIFLVFSFILGLASHFVPVSVVKILLCPTLAKCADDNVYWLQNGPWTLTPWWRTLLHVNFTLVYGIINMA